MQQRLFILLFCCCGLMYACTKNKSEPVCTLPLQLQTTTTPSHPCTATGSITILLPIANDLEYRLNNNAFQTGTVFNPVKAGMHTITVNQKGACSKTFTVTVDTITAGPQFMAVAAILKTNCSRCHSGINPQAGLDWLNPCDIIPNWSRIKARAVDGNPTPMPPTGLMPAAQRQAIEDWINAGHSYTN